MKIKKNKTLFNLLLILGNIFLSILIIKECKILNFSYTLIMLISPIFFGYGIAWLVKPVMLFFNKNFKVVESTIITYIILISVVGGICYFTFPIIVTELKNLIPQMLSIYKRLDPVIIGAIDLNVIMNKLLSIINKYSVNIKDLLLNIFYSLFISFFFLTNHKSVSKFLASKVPTLLIYRLSINLKGFVKGTLIDTVVLFFLSILFFSIAKLPYAFLFAIIISLTNIIPFVGPYLGGVPSVLVALSVSSKLGLIVFGIVVLLQVIESAFIHPYIMSKSCKINPILIMISLIISGYFFGIIGMLLSTPIVTVIKTLYLYNKEFKVINLKVLYK